MAFLTLVNQGPALIGPHGLLRGDVVPRRGRRRQLGSRWAGFGALPSVFWLGGGDTALRVAGWVGVLLALSLLAGYANALTLAVLCALQISISNVGQTFYAFGWELQLFETEASSASSCAPSSRRAAASRISPPPAAVIWLLRWLAVRIMWGAGLIFKLRGDLPAGAI